ncbi:MAG: cytochrome c4 [Rhodanobacter sp.]|jgi:cytochrome c553|nr:cytochrome c4 [Rhodanobacter sp.]
MSFRSAGFRPAVLGSAVALVFALSAGALMAQDAQPEAAPAAASTAVTPAAATTVAPAPVAAPTVADALKPGDATAGQAKAAVCGACHGMDGNSTNPQFPKLAGQSAQYIVRQLNDFKSGKRANPIMSGMAASLSEQDMHNVGAYFASKTSVPGVADQALVEHGEKLFRQGDLKRGIPACMACHSINGRGNPGAIYPQLAGQHAGYVQATLKAWHDGTKWGDDGRAQIMPSIASKLTGDDIAALASYVEGLHSTDNPPAAAAP